MNSIDKAHQDWFKNDQSARIAELERSESFLKECIDAAIKDREYYEQKYKEVKAEYDECSQAVFWLGKERDGLKIELAELQAKAGLKD